MMNVNIKELILMYAPTIIMAVSVVLNYLKTFKALKTNVKNMENSKSVKSLNKKIGDLQFEIVSRSKYLVELKQSNEKLMSKIEELNKRIETIELNKVETIVKEKAIELEKDNETEYKKDEEIKEA